MSRILRYSLASHQIYRNFKPGPLFHYSIPDESNSRPFRASIQSLKNANFSERNRDNSNKNRKWRRQPFSILFVGVMAVGITLEIGKDGSVTMEDDSVKFDKEKLFDYLMNWLLEFHRGSANGDLVKLKRLLEELRVNVARRDEAEMRKLVELIMKSHVKPKDENDEIGATPIHRAAIAGSLEVVRFFVEELGVDLRVKMGPIYCEALPIHMAAIMGHASIVKFFLDKDRSLLEAATTLNETPFFLAALNGQIRLAKYLAKRGANVNIKNVKGVTTLHQAVMNNSLDVVKFLVEEAKVDLSIVGSELSIHSAVYGGYLEIVKYLLSVKPDWLEVKDGHNCTPLFHSAGHGNLEMVKFLVEEKRADVNAKCVKGATPLHAAVAPAKNLAVVRYLVEKCGAHVTAKEDSGFMPVQEAVELGLLDIVKFFLEESSFLQSTTESQDDDEEKVAKLAEMAARSKQWRVLFYLLYFAAKNDLKKMRARLFVSDKNNND